MAIAIVLTTLLLLMLAGFIAFYRHSRTPEWGDSEFRRSVLRMLVMIGPMFGVRYQEPHHEHPAVLTPGPEEEPLPRVSDDQAG